MFIVPIAIIGYNIVITYKSAKAKPQPTTTNIETMDEVYQSINLLTEVIFSVKYYYYNDIPISTLVKYAIKGITDNLDPYSRYLNVNDSKIMYDETAGQFAGVGIQIVKNKQGDIAIVDIINGSSAFKAGIKVGDILYAIDSFNVENLSLNEITNRLRGNPNTNVKLLLRRDNIYYDALLKRQIIKPIVVSGKIYDDVIYIKITTFNLNTNNELLAMLKNLQQSNRNTKGLILDLRDNLGGLVDQAIAIADNFLDNAKIASISSKGKQQVFLSKAGDILNNKPMVVLINANSASSAELLAGALKDNDRAVVVGNISYGKGLIQSLIPLGVRGEEIKLTTGEYLIPSGKSINNKGIEPDIYVFSNGEICNACNSKTLLDLKQREKLFLEKLSSNDTIQEYVDYQLRYAVGIVNQKSNNK